MQKQMIFEWKGGFYNSCNGVERIQLYVTEENNGYLVWFLADVVAHFWERDRAIVHCYLLTQAHFKQHPREEKHDSKPVETIKSLIFNQGV